MRTRTLTIGSFFSIAMAATLVGALVTSQVRRPSRRRPAPWTPPAARLAPRRVPSASTPSATSPARSTRASSTSTPRRRCACPAIATRSATSSARTTTASPPLPENDRGGGAPQTQHEPRLGLRDRQGPGYILTNRHVIEGADEINVSLPDGKRFDAKVVGQDARTDVALLKIEPKEAPDDDSARQLGPTSRSASG